MMKTTNAIIGIVGAAILCFVLGYVLGTSNTSQKVEVKGADNTAAKVEQPVANNAPTAPVGDSDILPVGTSAIKGNPNAAVTVIEFSEFQCPFCSRVVPTLKQIQEAYPQDVRIVFKHNPLSFHADAPLASEAAMAAGEQGKFWEYHDLLFQNQKALKREDLDKYAQQLQLDMGKFKQALDTNKFKAQVQADVDLANKVGARGTPNFFVNGIKVVGAKPFEEFKKVIDEELTKAKGVGYAARVKENFKKEAAPSPSAAGKPPADDPTVYKVPVEGAVLKGNKDGLVTIVEFSDFQCPFCSRVNPTLADLEKEFPGKIRVAFKHNPLPFHQDAPLASEASLAAGEQGKFWEYHDLVFQNQKALKREDLDKYAEQLQLNMGKFKQALDSGKFKAQVQADLDLGKKIGVRGTPHFFINGVRLSGAQPLDRFKAAVEKALERAKPLTEKGLKGDALYAEIMKTAVAEFKAPAAPAGGAPGEDPNKVYTIDSSRAPVKGNPNAKITIVEFSEFQCPFCARVVPTINELTKKYGDKINVRFMHQPLPFHADAPLASEAAMAAGEQGKFWEYHDLLFQNNKALKREDLEKYAEQLQLNMGKFKQALDSGKFKEHVKKDSEAGNAVGANGTPTFFINGRKLVGAQPQSAFEAIIEEELKKVK